MTAGRPPGDPPFTITAAGLTGIHTLDLARQLARRNVLEAYYTVLPASRTPGVPPHLVRRHLALLLPLYATRRWSSQRAARMIDHEFDRWASRRVVRADIAHALAGLGRRYRRAAKDRFGAFTVCDSGTTHIRYHQASQDAEHAKWGVPPIVWDRRSIEGFEREYAESDLILVPSTFAYRTFVERGTAAARLALVPYGVDCEEYRPVPKPDRTFRILFIGTLSLRKGLPYLLEAVSTLPWRDAELALRGSAMPESQALLARYRGTIPIRFVPPQPRAQLKELYSSASIFVLPSIEDAFGLVIGQALACGVPVIATTHTGGPDLIEDGVTGFIVPLGDAAALRDALTRAYEDRARLAEMGREARRRVERARGWGEYGDRIVETLAGALRRPAGVSGTHTV